MAGGLLFLIPVLTRLGMGEWLADHPELIELDLPSRLLREVARRVGVPEDDPLCEALGGGYFDGTGADEEALHVRGSA
jgi:hypothetical protein